MLFTCLEFIIAKETKIATCESSDSNLDEVLVGEVKGIDCEHVSDGWRACHQEGLAAQRRVDSEEIVVRGGFGKFPQRNPCVIGEQDWVVPCQNSSTLLYVSFVFVPVYRDAM